MKKTSPFFNKINEIAVKIVRVSRVFELSIYKYIVTVSSKRTFGSLLKIAHKSICRALFDFTRNHSCYNRTVIVLKK